MSSFSRDWTSCIHRLIMKIAKRYVLHNDYHNAIPLQVMHSRINYENRQALRVPLFWDPDGLTLPPVGVRCGFCLLQLKLLVDRWQFLVESDWTDVLCKICCWDYVVDVWCQSISRAFGFYFVFVLLFARSMLIDLVRWDWCSFGGRLAWVRLLNIHCQDKFQCLNCTAILYE